MTKVPDIYLHENVTFHLYGTVGATADGTTVPLGSAREQCMVVPLLLAKGTAVSRRELTEWMWGEGRVPDTAPDELEEHLTGLRRRLATLGLRQALVNRDQVCRLRIAPGLVDVHRFGVLVAEARRLDDAAAASRLRTALALCGGRPLEGLTGNRIDHCRHALREERRTAEIALMRVEVRLGRAEHHIPDLVRLSRERLADTEVVGLAVTALHGTGRQAEAADLYHRYREHLIELGMSTPKPMLELQSRISQMESH